MNHEHAMRVAKEILESTKGQIPRAVAGLSMPDRTEVAKALASIAAAAAFSATYIAGRSDMGFDQGHDKALRKANTVRRQVRRALGYHTTPDLHIEVPIDVQLQELRPQEEGDQAAETRVRASAAAARPAASQ